MSRADWLQERIRATKRIPRIDITRFFIQTLGRVYFSFFFFFCICFNIVSRGRFYILEIGRIILSRYIRLNVRVLASNWI